MSKHFLQLSLSTLHITSQPDLHIMKPLLFFSSWMCSGRKSPVVYFPYIRNLSNIKDIFINSTFIRPSFISFIYFYPRSPLCRCIGRIAGTEDKEVMQRLPVKSPSPPNFVLDFIEFLNFDIFAILGLNCFKVSETNNSDVRGFLWSS